jgi:hypothetical protein
LWRGLLAGRYELRENQYCTARCFCNASNGVIPLLPPMNQLIHFVTHPNVVGSNTVPVPQWPLSDLGKERMRRSLGQPWIRDITSVYCSEEQKAIDGAAILAGHLSLG